MWKISPNYYNTSFKWPLALEAKITIFVDRTIGWQLRIAENVVRNEPHGGFAVLSIVMSYFEMIAKYEEGYAQKKRGDSEHYFRKGVHSVFPKLGQRSPKIVDDLLGVLYSECRCGLYHSGITERNIILTGEIKSPMFFNAAKSQLVINPDRLVPALIDHFNNYERQLQDPRNKQLRENFEKRFDYLGSQT